jgi:CubicO group peptidase (beta-lactamase class C family)
MMVDLSKPVNPTDEFVGERLEHALGFFAKLLCSGIFVVGRDPEEFITNDLRTHVRPEGNPFDWDEVEVRIDRNAGTVTLALGQQQRVAIFNLGQGCTIIPKGASGVHFTPTPVVPNTPDPETTPWPMGDLLPNDPLPAEVDVERLNAALDRAFDDSLRATPERTRAMVVLYKDRLIAERYAPGFGPTTRQVSWSMGKSITAALIGILVKDGALSIDDPAPITEWRRPGDEHSDVRVRELLQMSSGLGFMRAQDEVGKLNFGWTRHDDHMYIYYGAIDVFQHSITRPQVDPPGSAWRYRNCDPLTLGKIVRQTVEARGESYLTFPQRALFDKLGMRHMVLEPDPWGNFIMTGFDYGTARDWSRFGLLHLRDGVWPVTSERILPEGWIDFITTPAPADDERHYGGQFWLNAGGRHARVPRDAFWPAGAWGQVVFTIPSREMVIVRQGHSLPISGTFDSYIGEVMGDILDAIKQ